MDAMALKKYKLKSMEFVFIMTVKVLIDVAAMSVKCEKLTTCSTVLFLLIISALPGNRSGGSTWTTKSHNSILSLLVKLTSSSFGIYSN